MEIITAVSFDLETNKTSALQLTQFKKCSARSIFQTLVVINEPHQRANTSNTSHISNADNYFTVEAELGCKLMLHRNMIA